jgi:2-keto-4-pentenoate hydratase/2-oxohepta-3-ene-1,7-dioic acid hydratase in catechol pathway
VSGARVMSPLPGDIIGTGTPAGVSPRRPGDVGEEEVEGRGLVRSTVIERWES